MRRSTERIVTSHAGSLPRPPDLIALLQAKETRQPGSNAARVVEAIRRSVAEVVRRQRQIGIDIVDDGEHSKTNFGAYAQARLSGLAPSDKGGGRAPTRDALAFPAVYNELAQLYGPRVAARGYPRPMPALACIGPIRFVGHAQVQTDIDNLASALEGHPREDAFITAISSTNLEFYYRNEYYASPQEFLIALADAMHEEYRMIVDAGFILQIDDPRLITHYNRAPGISVEECRTFIAQHIEALNHALRGIPEEKVRFHTCYSVNVAPRVHDLELRHYVDLMLRIKAQTYSIEASNPRHEHEWQVWEEVKLPAGKILMPGVVTHCSPLVEHPELVAQRIMRFASVVGRENVIAGNDCGFATSAAGDEVHADVAWAKLVSLAEGARLASRRLWGKA
jgi:5-methyltetrahydropteroyltriglutamate--homocysteine methyltransferase